MGATSRLDMRPASSAICLRENYHGKHHLALLLSIVLVVACAAFAGTTPAPRHRFWVSAGQGFGLLIAAAEYSCAYQTGRYLVMARCCATGIPVMIDAPPPYIADFGLLFGLGSAGRTVHRSVAAGISYVEAAGGLRTVGIPLEAGITWTPLPVVGIGATLFGNLNTILPFAGIVLHLRAGKLR